MPSTTAMLTALTGLNANARNIDVIGNNVANANTTAFKRSRMVFSNMFSRTTSLGTPPSESIGGTNPFQVGLGVKTAATQRDTSSGTPSATGDARDLAIDGSGFFIVQRDGRSLYTRNGAFRPNAANDLTTPNGDRLMGFGVDENFNIIDGPLTPINIPLGTTTIAEASTTIALSGNLNASGPLPAQGSRTALSAAPDLGFIARATAVPAPIAPNRVAPDTRLVDLEDPLLPGSGTALFTLGQSLELRGAEKGDKTLPSTSLAIADTTTLADLADFLSRGLGINTTIGPNPDGRSPGVTIDPATGTLDVVSNTGTVNQIDIEQTDLRLLDSAGTLVRYPFSPATLAQADGEAVRTTFIAYDSLGSAVEIDATLVLDSRSNTGTTWRYYIESPDHVSPNRQITTGTVSFDTNGQPVSTLPVTVPIDRSGTGADSPLTLNLFFSRGENNLTALTDDRSQIAATFRDGSPIGTLSTFAVATDGTIIGSFTNGLSRTLGRVALATFPNDEGLEDVGDALLRPAANSGPPLISSPTSLGAGRIVGGSLESSNVELGEEFIRLIMSSTGYTASSRVIRTTEELMQQLLVLGR